MGRSDNDQRHRLVVSGSKAASGIFGVRLTRLQGDAWEGVRINEMQTLVRTAALLNLGHWIRTLSSQWTSPVAFATRRSTESLASKVLPIWPFSCDGIVTGIQMNPMP